MKDALEAAKEFFNLPIEEKMLLLSDNIHEPVRYGTSLNHVVDRVHFWRDFIKHYSHPISEWIRIWPSNPPTYKLVLFFYFPQKILELLLCLKYNQVMYHVN